MPRMWRQLGGRPAALKKAALSLMRNAAPRCGLGISASAEPRRGLSPSSSRGTCRLSCASACAIPIPAWGTPAVPFPAAGAGGWLPWRSRRRSRSALGLAGRRARGGSGPLRRVASVSPFSGLGRRSLRGSRGLRPWLLAVAPFGAWGAGLLGWRRQGRANGLNGRVACDPRHAVEVGVVARQVGQTMVLHHRDNQGVAAQEPV